MLLIVCYYGNPKEYIIKVLSHVQHLISYNDTKIKVQFTGSCLKQQKFTFTHKKVVNIYIVYELGASSSHSSDPTIKNCLFGAVMVLDLIEDQVFHFQVGDLAKMY